MGFTYRTITEALDFAPNVTKIILPVGKCLKGAVLDPTQFSVAAKRIFNKPKDFVWPKFMGEKPEDALKGKRAIESLYVSDLEGNPQDDGNCITLNMVCAPMDSLGSTLLYDGSFNRLVEVKHEIVQTKPITTDEGILSGLVFDQLGGDRLVYGEWLKFGTFEHPDATLGYAHYEPEHTENEKLPLVIWLHGMGEGGANPTIAYTGNKVVALSGADIQAKLGGAAYVIAPQAPTMWMDAGLDRSDPNFMNTGKSIYGDALMALFNEFIDSHPDIDRDRILCHIAKNRAASTAAERLNAHLSRSRKEIQHFSALQIKLDHGKDRFLHALRCGSCGISFQGFQAHALRFSRNNSHHGFSPIHVLSYSVWGYCSCSP